MSVLTVELLEPASGVEVYLDETLTLRGRYTESPGTPQPVAFAAASVPPGISFGVHVPAAPNAIYEFPVPIATLGVGLHDLYLYTSDGAVAQVESNRIAVRIRYRRSEGQYVMFRDSSGYREYLKEDGTWTQREDEAWKLGTEVGALAEAASHPGALVAPKSRVFRGPIVA